jgi:multiple sugar transport system ATP-binding protein
VDAGLSHDPGIPSGGADRLAGVSQIVLDDVHKVYPDGTEAVRGVELTVPDGALAVLVGPSGCGKTTLLRMVAGLEAITDGQVRIGDRVVNDVSPKDRDLAMVFQDYALYPQMSVFENMAFGLRLRKMARSSIRARVEDAARSLGLAELLTKRPRQLSGGQRQRVAMGRAIVREPKGFLMDEPLSNLDAKLRVQMRAEIASLQRELAVTTVYVTHDQVEAMTMGDRVAVLKDGYLQQVDTPQNLYDRPVNVFVGAFIGSPSMNLYEGKLSVNGEVGTVTIGSNVVGLPRQTFEKQPALRGYDGKPVIVGIRPEDFEDAEMATDVPESQRITATVSLIEALGSEIMVHFRIDAPTVDSGDPDAVDEREGADVANAVGRFNPRSRVRMGDTVDVAVSSENMHFFDPETRQALWA